MKQPHIIAATLAALFLLLPCRQAAALSLDISHENTTQLLNDRLDSAAEDLRFYENFYCNLSDPGETDLSCAADINVSNYYAPVSGSRFDLGSLYLDWQKAVGNAGFTLGRQFLSEFSTVPSYFDGLLLRYEGSLLSARAYGGMRAPSRFETALIQTDGKALQAGLWTDVRPLRFAALGLGVHAQKNENRVQELRLAASLNSRIGRHAGINSACRYETSGRTLEYYSVRLRSTPGSVFSLGIHGLGQSSAIDSLNFYRRMFLARFNEGGASAGLRFGKDAFLNLDGAMRYFADGSDLNLGATGYFHGLSLRFGSVSGVSGQSWCLVPAYSLRYREIAELSASGTFWHYEADTSGPVVRDAAVYALEGRWFAPLRARSFGLVVQPRFEYLVNNYYRRDVRLWLFTRLDFSLFRESASPESGQE
jgi:hypothetical protein